MKKKELVIASFGLFKNQCTLEVLAQIKTCDIVFSHILEGETIQFLKRLSLRFKVVKNLKPDKTAQYVVSAFKECDKICFLTYGNPMFLNATTAFLKEKALRKDIKITILNAVSSFDAIISVLGLNNEFSSAGIRVVDLSSCLKDMMFTPEMDTLFFMAGDLNLKENKKYKSGFIKKLMAVYPKNTSYAMVDVKSIAKNSDTLLKGNVSDLAENFNMANERTTLFLPAIKIKSKTKK